MRWLEPRVPALTLPLYVVHGMRDKTTSFDAVDDLVRRVGSNDVTFNKVEGEDGHGGSLMRVVFVKAGAGCR
jgi:alpha-beta hydrolase superfamily lysophospholipase